VCVSFGACGTCVHHCDHAQSANDTHFVMSNVHGTYTGLARYTYTHYVNNVHNLQHLTLAYIGLARAIYIHPCMLMCAYVDVYTHNAYTHARTRYTHVRVVQFEVRSKARVRELSRTLTNLKSAVQSSVRVRQTFEGSVKLYSMCLSK
jgi:hypothetical protein